MPASTPWIGTKVPRRLAGSVICDDGQKRRPEERRAPTHRAEDQQGEADEEERPSDAEHPDEPEGEVEWKPALDVNRLALQRTGAIIAGLFVLRSIIRTLVRR
jgi:hypothetical protein